MEFKTFVFYVLATVLVFASLRVVTLRNPVHAALHLILAFFSASGIWILLQAEFLAIVLVLVYVGAVMVLFLFVVMLLDIDLARLREGFWSYLPMADKAFKESPIPISIAFFIVLTLFAGAAIMLDYLLPSLYEKLSEKGACRKVWLGAAYFSGLIPGFAILSFLGLYYANGMRLDPFTASFFLLEVFSFVFYGKIILGMMTFGIYLFLALSGTKGRRITVCAFSGIFWLMLLYIPMVISLHLPQASWQVYMDPSYLPMIPFVSDLWLTGIAIWGGKKVTEWIFR